MRGVGNRFSQVRERLPEPVRFGSGFLKLVLRIEVGIQLWDFRSDFVEPVSQRFLQPLGEIRIFLRQILSLPDIRSQVVEFQGVARMVLTIVGNAFSIELDELVVTLSYASGWRDAPKKVVKGIVLIDRTVLSS